MCLHPRFMTAVGQLLDVPEDEIRLTQSLVGKQGTPVGAQSIPATAGSPGKS